MQVRNEDDIERLMANNENYDDLEYLGFYLVEPSQTEMFLNAVKGCVRVRVTSG